MIKVLLVDDHDLVRTGIRSILEGTPDISVIGEASSGEQAVEMVRHSPPDIVLMDVNMPGIGGLEATRKILRIAERVKVIALTIHAEQPFPEQLHEAGAAGYLTKGCDAEEMCHAIRTVHDGKSYIEREVAQSMMLDNLNKKNKDEESPFERLSNREMQVMLMITKGINSQEISDALCLSPKTVSTYRHRLFEKLDVRNDVELTHLALRHGVFGDATT